MSNQNLKLMRRVVDEVSLSGRAYSKDVFRDCYFADLSEAGDQEPLAVSEKWIDYYWARLKSVPFQRLLSASVSDERLAKLLLTIFNK